MILIPYDTFDMVYIPTLEIIGQHAIFVVLQCCLVLQALMVALYYLCQRNEQHLWSQFKNTLSMCTQKLKPACLTRKAEVEEVQVGKG